MKNEWTYQTREFDAEKLKKEESLFTVANGTIGLRGNMEECLPAEISTNGTYVNGFYERSSIQYGEQAYGYADSTETMLNAADTKEFSVEAGRERFSLLSSRFSEYERSLDMRSGVLSRRLKWETEGGELLEMSSRRMASMEQPNLVLYGLEIEALRGSAAIRIRTGVNGDVQTGEKTKDPRIAGTLGDGSYGVSSVRTLPDGTILLAQKTSRSEKMLICAVKVFFYGKNETFQVETDEQSAFCLIPVTLPEGERVKLWKYAVYVFGDAEEAEALEARALTVLREAEAAGPAELLAQQEGFYERFWKRADISVLGDPQLTASMRFNVFQLLQSVGRDGKTSIAAKGLSGAGYGGHYFWESEAFILPVFLYTMPEIARELLVYRHSILDNARRQARLLGHKSGALFAWRSIDGQECSAYYPGGSAQYHINADVSLAVARYAEATGDGEFMASCGLEILLETARLWCDVGHFNPLRQGAFCIDCVTGPDEYTAVVNNNYYTNIMARENLKNAVKWGAWLRENNPAAYAALTEKIGFDEAEYDRFRAAAQAMYLPYDETLRIHKQDDSFLDKKPMDLSVVPPEQRPLLQHFHPLFIYRHQVLKQADLLQAAYNLPQYFDPEDLKRDYEYYERVTIHDSSLSVSIYSIMAAFNGNIEKAYQYFMQTVRTDLDDKQRNTKDGLHMANMAGAWLCIVHGLAGMRVLDSQLSFSPICPDWWEGYAFSVTFAGREAIQVTVNPSTTAYVLAEGEQPLQIVHNGQPATLQVGKNVLPTKKGEKT